MKRAKPKRKPRRIWVVICGDTGLDAEWTEADAHHRLTRHEKCGLKPKARVVTFEEVQR